MSVGQLITASRFNIMQSKIATILGNGSGQFGYGQIVNGTTVNATTDFIEASDLNSVRLDIINAYVHQTGSLPVLPTLAIGTDVEDATFVTYETLANTIFVNKNLIFEATQASVETKLNSTRSSQWGGTGQPQTIYHKFNVVFINSDHRRHFFNAGGEIRFVASLTGGSSLKDTNWASILSAMGTVKFNYLAATGLTGLSGNIGNFDLTSSFQTIYTKAPATYFYSTNDYVIKAKGDQNSNIIEFSVEFTDGTRGSVDDPVTGTITSSISQLRPTGIYVEVPTPIFNTVQTLS